MRNSPLHELLESFTADAAMALCTETAGGAEVPFEVVETETRAHRVPMYCYRPLTGAFIRDRLGRLSAMPSYAAAARAIESLDRIDQYLRDRGETRIPTEPRERADAALRSFLGAVFAERSEFEFDAERFEDSYAELERVAYAGTRQTTVLTPLLGLMFDHSTRELGLEDGFSLVRGEDFEDAPADAVWSDGAQPCLLAVLVVSEDEALQSPASLARKRFRRLLTAIRLFDRGGFALGPVAWLRPDGGQWRTVALGGTGRPRLQTLISRAQEDELRGFYNLIARRSPTGGELAWALSRFEMGCERLAPFEALTDYLLALRALLEPEGPSSGRLAQRLAAMCAEPLDRCSLAERTAHAISLERAVIAGLAPAEPGVDALVDELAEHLRALLRDALCGHLDTDLRAVADSLLGEAAAVGAA